MNLEKRLQVGDIIKSKQFAFGRYEGVFNKSKYLVANKELITVDGETRTNPVNFRKPGTEEHTNSKYICVDLGAYDESRGNSSFVVEEAKLDGGGTGHGPYDIYPDGWHILARKLGKDETYDPKGQLIQFYQDGSFDCVISEIEVVGKMKRMFIKTKS
jgi:hypothetical protein